MKAVGRVGPYVLFGKHRAHSLVFTETDQQRRKAAPGRAGAAATPGGQHDVEVMPRARRVAIAEFRRCIAALENFGIATDIPKVDFERHGQGRRISEQATLLNRLCHSDRSGATRCRRRHQPQPAAHRAATCLCRGEPLPLTHHVSASVGPRRWHPQNPALKASIPSSQQALQAHGHLDGGPEHRSAASEEGPCRRQVSP